VLLLAITLWVAAAHPQLVGDTHGLVLSSDRVAQCLRHGPHTFCDRRPDGRIGGWVGAIYQPGRVGPYPLMQYLLAVPLTVLRVGADATLRLLILVDFAALLATVALVWWTAKRLGIEVWGPILTLCLVISPLLWYSTASFGEVLAGALLVAVVAAVAGGWRPLAVTVAVALACVTKETNPPFVVAMVLLAASARQLPAGSVRGQREPPIALPVTVGLALGVLLNSLFNVLRYGSIWNETYVGLSPSRLHASLLSSNFVALAVRRDGGLVWFWPAAVGVIAFGVIVALLPPHPRGWRRLLPFGPVALLTANQVGLAAWISPFGWVAWGPRLSLPMVPPLLLLTAVLLGRRGATLMGRFLRTGWIWLLGATLTIGGLPQLGFLRAGPILQRFFHPYSTCPPTPVSIHLSRTEFCRRIVTGARIPILLDGVRTLGTPLGALAGLALAGTVAGLLTIARTTPLAVDDAADGSRSPRPDRQGSW